ncbi:hypothetical protein [Shumkonia mesophila]|uniref:hypothetical protein n=1 Tax=Shumkonia mesophila TaxID=2838854 RepID=UPI00293469A3|nr:hypothetical protein [Shumkonia mesophila]
MNDLSSFRLGKYRSAENPRTVRQRMNALDLSRFGGEPEGLRCDTEQPCGVAQIEPWFHPVRLRTEARDFVMRPERSDPLARPAIGVSGYQAVPVEDAGNQIITGDEH